MQNTVEHAQQIFVTLRISIKKWDIAGKMIMKL